VYSEDRIQELLLQWEEARERGVMLSPEQLTDNPEEQKELRKRIKRIESTESFYEIDIPFLEPDPAYPKIPGYIILERLKPGGMGIVYIAKQESLNRLVALKVIREGHHVSHDTLQRFKREADIAAGLKHVNIVEVYDYGTPNSLPYIAMEYIPGTPLSDRLPDFSTKIGRRAAAAIIIQAAYGLQYAHDRRIIHRDIKPSNIIIDNKQNPKIIDFGLSRYVDDNDGLTDTGVAVGTACYMSPEQARAEKNLTIRTDVYSLGATLYELLTGKPLFIGNYYEVLIQIETSDPPPLRKSNSAIEKDLETICLKCLKKDQNERYDSARMFADDLQCWLDGKPIAARPSGPIERAIKFARRQPWIAACGVLILALAVTAPYLFLSLEETKTEKKRAINAFQGTAAINGFVGKYILSAARPFDFGGIKRDATLLDVLDSASMHVEKEFKGQPELESNVRSMFGMTYFMLGNTSAAELHFQRALTLSRQAKGTTHEDSLFLQVMLGNCGISRGRISESLVQIREATDQLIRMHDDDIVALDARIILGEALAYTSLNEAEEWLRNAMEVSKVRLGAQHEKTLMVESLLGDVLTKLGKWKEAEDLLMKVYETQKRNQGEDNLFTLCTISSIVSLYNQKQVKFEESEKLISSVISARKRLLGDNHPNTLAAYNIYLHTLFTERKYNVVIDKSTALLKQFALCVHAEDIQYLKLQGHLAAALWQSGQLKGAEEIYQIITKSFAHCYGANSLETLTAKVNLSSVIGELNRLDEAESMLRDCLNRLIQSLGDDHPMTLVAKHNLAWTVAAQGRHEEAERLWTELLTVRERIYPTEHRLVLFTKYNLVCTKIGLNKLEEAEKIIIPTLQSQLRVLSSKDSDTLRSQEILGVIYLKTNQLTDAEYNLKKAYAIGRDTLPSNSPQLLNIKATYAFVLIKLKKYAEAEAEFRTVVKMRRISPGSEHIWTKDNELSLAKTLIMQSDREHPEPSKLKEAEELLKQALVYFEKQSAKYPIGGVVTNGLLGECFRKMGRFQEAEAKLLECHQKLSTNKSASDVMCIESLQRLVELYESRQMSDKALEWKKKLSDRQLLSKQSKAG